MKHKSLIITILLMVFALGFGLHTEAKPKATKVYMLGFATCFTDSIAYMTEVQLIDPAYIETKSHFLYDRSLYSLQFSNYIEEKLNIDFPTCAVFFSTKKKAIMKKRSKLQKKYSSNESFRLKPLTLEEFSFYPEEWIEHDPVDEE